MGRPAAVNVGNGHGEGWMSNQPERLDRWYSIVQPYAQPQAGIRSEGDAAVRERQVSRADCLRDRPNTGR
jgi:hypothetical protein